jgi:2-C-methyl-D-erythritol 4-phosphate cytidylyltransferase
VPPSAGATSPEADGGTWALVAAAGVGERMGSDLPKAFVPFGGRPLLAESIERLDLCPWVDAIVVAVSEDWVEPAILLAEELVASKVVAVVAGGASRAESVRLALAEVPGDALVVLVHDAARPLLADAVVERLLAALTEGWDGVVPALPVADTLKRVEGGVVLETVSRDDLVAVQTPQAFPASTLRAALAGDLEGATDCAALVERTGGRVGVVDGDQRLLKITTQADLELVERLAGAGYP